MSSSNSIDSSFDSFANVRFRKNKERSLFRNSRKSRKNEEKIIKIRIDISCPNNKIFYDQIERGLSLRKISIKIDRRNAKIFKKYSDEFLNGIASNMEHFNDALQPKYTLNSSIIRSKTDVNLINIKKNQFGKRRSSLQLHQYSAFLNYPKELLSWQKRLFNPMQTIIYDSETIKINGDSLTEIVNYEHEIYADQKPKSNFMAKTVTNTKISIVILRDADDINSLKICQSKNQNLMKTENFFFDFDQLSDLNRENNSTTFFTYFRYPYAKICELDYKSLMLNDFSSDNLSRPSEFELSKGNSNFEIGLNLSENVKFESFQTYVPLYIDFKNSDMSNDDILSFIERKIADKTEEMHQELLNCINLKFPLDFLFYNAGRKNPSIKDLTFETDEPQFYLLSYQVLDEKFEPLEYDLIDLVKINYSILNGVDGECIKNAIYSAIGHQAEAYSCNFFRMWNYIVLIKQPRIYLNSLIKDKILMKDFDLIKNDADPGYDMNHKTTYLYFLTDKTVNQVQYNQFENQLNKSLMKNFSQDETDQRTEN